MPLIKWSPFFPFDPFDEMDQVSSLIPAADISETDTEVLVEIPLAGVDPDKVDISIGNDVLVVQGTMERKSEVEEREFVRKEIKSGSFYRRLPLPAHVVGEQASAISENGLLKISVPKISSEDKKIKVKIQSK